VRERFVCKTTEPYRLTEDSTMDHDNDALDPPTTDDERVAEAAAREVAAGPNGTAEPVGAEAASSTEASNGELPFREEDW